MTRYSAFILTLLCICAGGCASRSSVADLGERMVFLEREVLAARTDENALKDEVHELDLRVEYLEREALKRGAVVAPRRTGTPSVPDENALSSPALEKSVPAPISTPNKSTPTSPTPAGNTAPVKKAAPTQAAAPPPDTAPGTLSASAPAAEPLVASPAASPTSPPLSGEVASEAPTTLPPAMLPRLTASPPATPAPAAAPSRAPARPEQNAYDAALQMYRTGRYAESEAAFQAFLEVYPNSRLVPNALYWKGETYYSRGRYPDAIFAFKDVQARFPRDAKTPDSLLKTAMAYQKMGDAANASLHLAVLFEDWPKAEATQRARRMGLKP